MGSAILRELKASGYSTVIGRTSSELDLRNQQEVNRFFETEKPEIVFVAAAKVGGIYANKTYKADFLYDNLMIASNIIHAAYLNGVEKLIFLASSCIYPKEAATPIAENQLLSGSLESTNEPYAVAKIAGMKLCESYRIQHGCNFISVIPSNLYGKGDNYHLMNAHVLPTLIRKFHEAKLNEADSVVLWGTGTPEREFLYVDDLAQACVFLMENYNEAAPINVGSGNHISIKELAQTIQKVVGFKGTILWDETMPNGTLNKWMDVSKMKSLGWKYKTELLDGIRISYEDFLNHHKAYAI